ncbi:TPA: S-methyl-5'-thioadenosine phosphorylase, partial [Candidatus Micrarchaeota archaeon]|nr:S-methyl-5'-thioadenosine phosphorylase [Candidatus Micrarchaeota archaeon]
MKVGVIGGSALEKLFADEVKRRKVLTKYGAVGISCFDLGGTKVFFLPRHGPKHEHPPHRVNYRANVLALRTLGVERIIATNAVGSLREEIKPGTLVVPHQLVDLTKTRYYTFFDDRTMHVDFTEPFCREVRN